MNTEKKSARDNIIELITTVTVLFLEVLFIFGAWSILAPHFNAPLFTYWETMLILLAFRAVTRGLRK